ncbi:MAG: hypothetical protein ACI8SE_002196, partial [Bacteroidia bacterium]
TCDIKMNSVSDIKKHVIKSSAKMNADCHMWILFRKLDYVTEIKHY